MVNKPAIAAAIVALTIFSVQPAAAFDPQKAFGDTAPSFGKIWNLFRSAKDKGEQDEAISILEFAASRGYRAAEWKLGHIYRSGDGVPSDDAVAFRHFQTVVSGFDSTRPFDVGWQYIPNAMVALGHYYNNGIAEAGIEPDRIKAILMFNTAATYYSNTEAKFELARLYLDDDSNPQYFIPAARLLRSACISNHAGATALLGSLLFEGEVLRRERVRGMAMMIIARNTASAADLEWINPMLEQALALSSAEQRRAAAKLADNGQSPCL